MPDLSVIIVSWNVADLLATCLDTIFAQPAPDLEVIVVDSASSDPTVAMLHQHYPQVRLLPQTENLGFSRCNNIGLAAAQGRHILLLNPDTEIIGDALAQMVRYLDAHPDVGILGPHTLNTDHSTQSTRRTFPTVPLAFFESTWLQRFTPKSMLARYYLSDHPDTGIFDVDWVQGSAIMARHEVYQQIGGLDEGYIMFSEELDWCRRARNVGWRVVYLGTTQIIHHGGKSTDQVVARRHIHFQESKLRYFRKYHGRFVAAILRLYLLLSYLVQIAVEGLKTLLGHKAPMRRERIRAYWQVLRSGLKVT